MFQMATKVKDFFFLRIAKGQSLTRCLCVFIWSERQQGIVAGEIQMPNPAF